MTTFGQHLRQHRHHRGLSIAQLARAAELTESTIYRLEAESRTQPRADTLQAIADALDITTDELLGRDSSVEQAFGVQEVGNTLRLPVLTTIRGGQQ